MPLLATMLRSSSVMTLSSLMRMSLITIYLFCIFVPTSDAVEEMFLLNLIRSIKKDQWARMAEVERDFGRETSKAPSILGFSSRKGISRANIVEQNTSNIQKNATAATAAVVEAAEDEELALFLKHDDILASETRRKDYGIVRGVSKDITESQHELYRRALSLELGRHAAVVFRGTPRG
ncbi:hypothetical protein Peur_072909 [Populus x canadensis]